MRRERGSRIRGGGRGRGVLLLAACLSLTCGGNDGTSGDRVLRGVVYTTEPVVGASVTVRSLFNDFAYCTGVPTADDGSFVCPILAGDDGNWYVVAEGGAGLPAGTTLRGGVLDVVPLEERTITVSPVSDLAVALADARLAAGKDPDRIAAYHTAVALFDAHWDTDPFDADVKDLSAPSSLDDGAKLTLAIHGLAQLAAQAAVEQGVAAGSLTQLQLLALLRQDVAAPGEVFDGEGGALRLGTCADGLFLCEVGADSLRGYLGGAILAFARTPANGTGLGRDDLLTWLERLRTNAEPQLFGAAAVGPFDPLAPTVSWAAPSEGTTFNAGQSIAIDVSAADANGVASLTVEVVGATATVTDTDPSPERFVAMVPVAGLPEGPLTLTAIARDLDDNPASASRGVVIDQVSGGTISGTVTKGRVAGATVTAYRYGNGARGAAVGTGTTDAMGNLTNLLVADGTAGPILLEATGGSYAEDAQPATSVTLDVADRLRTVIPAYTDGASLSTVQLTPLTELAVAYLEYLTSTSTGGADLAARWATAHGAIEAHFGVSNVRDVTPSTPAQVDTLAANDRYGLVLLGISRAAWRASAAGGGDAGAFGSAVNGYAVTRAWARDLGDGCWDGRAGTTMLTYGGVTPLTAEAARLHLAQAIVDYLGDGARNQTTFTTAADVLPLLDTVALAATSAPGACAGGALFATPGRPFDREPPVITFGAFPATDPFVRGTFDVTATATDNLDTEPSLTFTSGQTDIDIDRSEVRATIATAALPDGALTIGLASQDDSGNAATATRTVTVDNTAPAVTITAPALAGGVYRTLNVAWTTVEPNVAATTAEVDGVAIVNGGGVSAEGPHTLTVTVDDRAGNRTTVTRTFTIDTAAPTISLTAPADGAHVRGPVTITFAATDPNPGATATATLDGAPITSPHVVSAEGSHTLVVNATDAAGNAAAAVTRTFTIDNTAPVVNITAPAAPGGYYQALSLAYTVTDANLGPVAATLDGATPVTPGFPVATNGAHTLRVVATDLAGNMTDVSRPFFVDTVGPTITTVVAPSGAVVRPPITITATATDNLMAQGSLGAALAVTGTPPLPAGTPGAPADGSRTLALTYATAADGPLAATFTIADRAGNAATPRTVNLTVDQTNPTLTWSTAGLTLVGGTYWTSAATVTLTGTATDANLAGVSASWPGGSATATLAGASWTIAGVPAPTAGHAITVRATDLAGNFVEATRTLRSDVTPPVVDFTTTTVRDESADTVTFSTGTSAAYSGPTRDPNHNHVGPAVTLGAADSCSTAPVVKKYAYLLDEVRPHVAESNGDGPGGSNPLRIAVAPTDDGVGLTTVQYRVVNGVTGTPLLDWTTLASPTAQLVPLYRAGVTAPSIPALGTTTGLVRFEARAVDALGRTGSVSSRCWNQTLYAAPIEMGEPAAVAATNGPAGSGKWGLGLLSLADATSPIDPVSMMLNDVAGPAGAGLYEFSVWNPTNETVYLSVDVDAPPSTGTAAAKWSNSYYAGKWVYRQTTVNTNCTLAGSCAFDPDVGVIICEIDYSRPGCEQIGPLGPSNNGLQSRGPVDLAASFFDVRIWRQDPVTGTLTELTQCAGCSTTPSSGVRRVSVALPPRGAGDVPPVRYWIMPVLRPNSAMAPAAGVAGEHQVAGQYLTGNVMESRTGCHHFDQRGATGVFCDTRREYWKMNYLKSISVTNVGGRSATVLTSHTAMGVPVPPENLDTANVRSLLVPSPAWTTSDPEALPTP